MKKNFWIKIVILGVLCGVLLGACAFAAQKLLLDADSGETEDVETDGNGNEGTAGNGNGERQETHNSEWDSLLGSYVGKSGSAVTLHLTDITGPQDIVGKYTILYIDEITEKDSELWGHTSLGSLNGWMRMSELAMLSSKDYSVKEGDLCYVITGMENNFHYEASDDVSLMCTVPFGTELSIGKISGDGIRSSFDGKNGWIDQNSIAVFRTELPYAVGAFSGLEAEFRMDPSPQGALIGTIKAGTVLRFTDFSGGYGRTTIGTISGWVSMTSLFPVNEKTPTDSSVSAITFTETELSETEPPTEKVTVTEAESETEPFETDFYKDGTHNPKNGYILPESASEYLDERDLSNLTLKGLCYAKNEIYARHGRKFKSKELQAYFNSQPWYKGTLEPSDSTDTYIVNSLMNSCERHNKDVLYSTENKQGMYDLDK